MFCSLKINSTKKNLNLCFISQHCHGNFAKIQNGIGITFLLHTGGRWVPVSPQLMNTSHTMLQSLELPFLVLFTWYH